MRARETGRLVRDSTERADSGRGKAAISTLRDWSVNPNRQITRITSGIGRGYVVHNGRDRGDLEDARHSLDPDATALRYGAARRDLMEGQERELTFPITELRRRPEIIGDRIGDLRPASFV